MTQGQEKKKKEEESEPEDLLEDKEEKQKKTKKRVPLEIKESRPSSRAKYSAKISEMENGVIKKKDLEKRDITTVSLVGDLQFSTGIENKSFGTLDKARGESRGITTVELYYSRNFQAKTKRKGEEGVKPKESTARSRTIPSKYKSEFNAEIGPKEFSKSKRTKKTEEKERVKPVRSATKEGNRKEEITVEEEPEFELNAKRKSLGMPRDEPYVIFLRGDEISYQLWSRLLLEEIENRGIRGHSHELDIDRIRGEGGEKVDIKDLNREQRFITDNRLIKVREFSMGDLKEVLENESLNSFFKMFLGRGDGLRVMLCKVSKEVYLEDRTVEGKIIRDELLQRLKQLETKGRQIIFYSMNFLGTESRDRMDILASLLDIPKNRNFPTTLTTGGEEVEDEILSEWTNVLDSEAFNYDLLAANLSKELNKNIDTFGDKDTESLQHIAMKMLVYQTLLTEKNLKAEPDFKEELPAGLEEEDIKIEYPGEFKIGDLYVPEKGLWIEVETGRLIGKMKNDPEQYIFRKMTNLQEVNDKISKLWLVLPLRKLFTWGERTLEGLRKNIVKLLENRGIKNQQVRIKFCDFRNGKIIDLQSP